MKFYKSNIKICNYLYNDLYFYFNNSKVTFSRYTGEITKIRTPTENIEISSVSIFKCRIRCGRQTTYTYLKDNRRHRKNKPALIIYKNRKIYLEEYYFKGELSNINGKPAVIKYDENGNIVYKKYYINGKEYSSVEYFKKILEMKLQ